MAKLSSTHIYGDLYADGAISGANSITLTTNNTYIYGVNTSGSKVAMLRLTSGNVTDVGNTSGHTCLLGNANPTFYNGSTTYTLYHTGNKPTPADIGAAASSHGTHLTIGTGASNAAAGNHTHNAIVSRGNVTCESGITARPAVDGLSMSHAYNNGYPTTYGNVISLKGTGDGQILVGWSGTDGAHAPVYVRSKRDNTTTANWSGWAQFYTTAHKPTPADIGAAAGNHTHSYLPLSGGTISSNTFGPLIINRSDNTYGAAITFKNTNGVLGHIAMTGTKDGGLIRYSSDTSTSTSGTAYTILDTGNYKTHVTPANIGAAASSHGTHVSYGGNGSATTVSRSDHTHSYLPLSGGTMTGKITTPNNAQGITIGDDIHLCDRNIADHLVLEGSTATNGGITFGSGKDTNIYRGGANLLKTDDTFNAVGGLQWNGQSLDSRYAAASHGTHLTIGTGASNAAAGNHTHSYAASSHNHGLLHDSHAVTISDTTTDSGWSMINSSYNGFILKSIRSGANAPAWHCNNFSAGIAFGGADTKGVLSCAYNAPSIKIAGGNGTKPVWWVGLTGTSGTTYDLNRINTAYNHSQAGHAPSNAQKNSDITKAEIEAKLTGTITTHAHNYAAASHGTHLTIGTGASNAAAGNHTHTYFSRSSAGDIGWGTTSNQGLPTTVAAIAYWNGAYQGTSSNLAYCAKGAFGTIVTKNSGDYLGVSATAAAATKLATARNIKIGNTSKSFNGTADVTWSLGEIMKGQGLTAATACGTLYYNNAGTGHVGRISCYNNDNGDFVQLGCYNVSSSTNANYINVYANHIVLGSYTIANAYIRPLNNGSIDLGASNYRWRTVYSANGVSTTSDRTLKENIKYVRAGETEIGYNDMYNFVKDDLELATYNYINSEEKHINFIAQDLLANEDGTDNKVGQFIINPVAVPAKEEIENGKPYPLLSYNTNIYTSVLAGALKESISKIETLESEKAKMQAEIDELKADLAELKAIVKGLF